MDFSKLSNFGDFFVMNMLTLSLDDDRIWKLGIAIKLDTIIRVTVKFWPEFSISFHPYHDGKRMVVYCRILEKTIHDQLAPYLDYLEFFPYKNIGKIFHTGIEPRKMITLLKLT